MRSIFPTLTRAAALALLLIPFGLLACGAPETVEEAETPQAEPAEPAEPVVADEPMTAAEPLPADLPPLLADMLGAYETARVALLNDHLDGVADAAAEIRSAAESLAEEQDPELEELLPSLIAGAEELAQAAGTTDDITAARDAFWAVSEPLMKYRELTGADAYRVAYCPMAQKSWLQPEGEIGNPYYGQSMAQCGAFVEKEMEG